MRRQVGDRTTAEVGRLRDKRPLSAETAAKAQEIADYWMELDARRVCNGGEFTPDQLSLTVEVA